MEGQQVAAVRGSNRAESPEQSREFRLRRRVPPRRPVPEPEESDSAEVVDQLPPVEVLRMAAELEKEREEEL
ncbi:MAG TPA: hypothetical protein VMU19_12925 [Bryobacteraceae bacterium]|nr:hypothetical protein [Bryobacteraceae bacterium]